MPATHALLRGKILIRSPPNDGQLAKQAVTSEKMLLMHMRLLSKDYLVWENRSMTREPFGVGICHFASSGVCGAAKPSHVLS